MFVSGRTSVGFGNDYAATPYRIVNKDADTVVIFLTLSFGIYCMFIVQAQKSEIKSSGEKLVQKKILSIQVILFQLHNRNDKLLMHL